MTTKEKPPIAFTISSIPLPPTATSHPPHLPHLPVELLLQITALLTLPDISHLTRTCHDLNNKLTPCLYRLASAPNSEQNDGQKPNLPNGATPLIWAVRQTMDLAMPVVRKLLQHQPTTAPHHSPTHHSPRPELLKGEKFLNAQDLTGKTALQWSCRRGDSHRRITEVLIQAGADLEVWDVGGRRALHYAVMGGCWKVVAQLLRDGCNGEARDHTGVSAEGFVAMGGAVGNIGGGRKEMMEVLGRWREGWVWVEEETEGESGSWRRRREDYRARVREDRMEVEVEVEMAEDSWEEEEEL